MSIGGPHEVLPPHGSMVPGTIPFAHPQHLGVGISEPMLWIRRV